PFRWIRGYQLGGRSLIWGRLCWRWSDLDFEANLRDGQGIDWPIRYKDLAPWYAHVERFVGVSGERLGLPYLPDGEFLPPWELNCAELVVKRGIERNTKQTREYTGRLIFLRASTLGTAQILLNSKTARFPTGLANSSGEVGHNLMDHISKAGASGTVPGLEDKYVYGRRPTGSYVPRFRNLDGKGDGKLGFLRGYGIQAGAGREGWSRGASEPGLGAELKQRLREP